jgi:hypothetical protein
LALTQKKFSYNSSKASPPQLKANTGSLYNIGRISRNLCRNSDHKWCTTMGWVLGPKVTVSTLPIYKYLIVKHNMKGHAATQYKAIIVWNNAVCGIGQVIMFRAKPQNQNIKISIIRLELPSIADIAYSPRTITLRCTLRQVGTINP